MSKYYVNSNSGGGYGKAHNRRRWITALKICAWIIGCLVVIAGCFFWWLSYYLSPERITKLIEEKSSEFLNADIRLSGLDYRLFSTYPWLDFEVDSLEIISKSLETVSPEVRDSLPNNADFLASVAKIKGKVNVHDLLHKRIKLKDIYLAQPRVNIVSVSDSVANFYIAPSMPKISTVPQIEISDIDIDEPVEIHYFSLQQNIESHLSIENFYLLKKEGQRYAIGIEGEVEGRYMAYRLPGPLPLQFDLEASLNLMNLTVNLYHFKTSLAGVKIGTEGDILIGKKNIDVKEAGLQLNIDNVFALEEILPVPIRDRVALPDHLDGSLPLNLAITLLQPFNISNDAIVNIDSIEDLPSFVAVVKVEDAKISLHPPGEKPVEADDIYLEATLNFDPQNPDETSFNINELRLMGEGINFRGEARVDNILGETQTFEGNFGFSSPLMKSLSYLLPDSGMKISGILDGKMSLSGEMENLGVEGLKDVKLKDIKIDGDMVSRLLSVKSRQMGSLRMVKMNTDFQAVIPEFPLNNYQGTKIGFEFKSDTLAAQAAGLDLLFTSFDIDLNALDTVSGTPNPYGTFLVKADRMNVSQQGNRLEVKDLNAKLSGTLNSSSSGNYTVVSSTHVGDDEIIASRIDHTPLVLEYSGGGILQTIMSMASVDADVKMTSAKFKTPDYLYPIEISGLELSTDLNDVTWAAEDVKISNTGFRISGHMEGLMPFMTSYNATPLVAEADIDFSNVDINRLSWGYYGAQLEQGKDSVFYVPPMLPFTASDSVCVVIPRNIDAQVRLKSKAAEYMGYRFSPLSTNITVKNGAATLGELTIGAPYCTAIVDWTYSTSDLANIFMDLNAKVVDFRFKSFYEVFPMLTAKAPEMENFTGDINATIGCHFRMFPNMFMNSNSLRGRFDIKGTELQFARTGKIARLTHLMLIEGDAPIKIDNVNISGGYHDNLLMLNPFKISFDDYQIEVGGVNNTIGNMYYHLALEKSPFHLPFGVSLSGTFNHPEVRLGGTRIDDYKAEEVSAEPTKNLDINIMAYLHHGWLLFVQEAAKYQQNINKK